MSVTLEKQVPKYEGRKVSAEEYFKLENDGYKYEVVEGVMQLSPSPNFEHGRKEIRFASYLEHFLRKRKIAKLTVECDVKLPDAGDVVRPDISIILKENYSIIQTHIFGAPDMVCEILSDSTRKNDLTKKSERYLKNGIREYWIIDLLSKKVILIKNRNSAWLEESSNILQSEVLEGFTFDTKEFFEED